MRRFPTAIAIGIAGPLSGKAALLGSEMKQTVELAIEEQQAAGGILGLPVRAEVAEIGRDDLRA